jgi:hypothetical protein
LQQGGNPGRPDGEAALSPQKVVEEQLNIELMNIAAEGGNTAKVLDLIRHTAKNPQIVEVEFTIE